MRETTALGAAYLAGLACGFWSSLDELKSKAVIERVFEPECDEPRREKLYAGWKSGGAHSRLGRRRTVTSWRHSSAAMRRMACSPAPLWHALGARAAGAPRRALRLMHG